jgi:hypothetical protein
MGSAVTAEPVLTLERVAGLPDSISRERTTDLAQWLRNKLVLTEAAVCPRSASRALATERAARSAQPEF